MQSGLKLEKVMMNNREAISVRSPGRINIIGEHTDYNGGFVLPAAIDREVVVKLKPNGHDSHVIVSATDLGETHAFDLNDVKPLPKGWQNYILGVVHELQQLGAKISGFEAGFSGNVPIGGGMSSSGALECSFAFALNEVFKLGFEKQQLILVSQMAEHHFAGVKCGIMDQFASMMGKKDHVLLLDCRSLEFEYFPLSLGKYQLLLLNTNVSHSLASSEYNTRRAECEMGVSILQQDFPTIHSLRDVAIQQLVNAKKKMSQTLYKRCHHVVSENQRVIEATKALTNGHLSKLGELVYQSHFSLKDDYQVSCPELDFLVNQTLDKDYVLGSRMMGGGFGGCTINIVESSRVGELVEKVTSTYKEQFGIAPTPYSVSIENGTSQII